jgi:RNA polymerase II-associated factor 1
VKKWDIVHVAHVPFTAEQLAERAEVLAEVNDPAYMLNAAAAAAAAEMNLEEGPEDDGEAEADGEVDVTDDHEATKQEEEESPPKAS